jgi:hypothetical protein
VGFKNSEVILDDFFLIVFIQFLGQQTGGEGFLSVFGWKLSAFKMREYSLCDTQNFVLID